jgi:hypothetical protein
LLPFTSKLFAFALLLLIFLSRWIFTYIILYGSTYHTRTQKSLLSL